MLVELRIRDYAVVDDLTLELGPGLNVLTGETGAGKSIIVGALSLLLGERASSGVVRAGAERATVEGVFEVGGSPTLGRRLAELGYEPEDGLLLLRREVAAEGRNRAWVNGSPATAGVVGELGNALVDLHGQHEHQTLLRAAEQRRILDAFAGAEDAASSVAILHAQVRALEAELEERQANLRDLEARADFLRFQLGEIEGAGLAEGEDEELEAEARRLEHAEELAEGATRLHDTLYAGEDAAADRIAEARRLLGQLRRFDESLGEAEPLLDEAYHALAEVGRRMGDYASSVDYDPRRLEAVQGRLDAMFRLKRKYGPELADVMATGERIRSELAELEDSDHELTSIRQVLQRARTQLDSAAATLTGERAQASSRLAEAVASVLPELGLPGAEFEVRLRALDAVGAHGAEAVEFLVSPNPGFPPMPLARIASGGELSRVMLALKSILAAVDQVPVLVFDEIDAGIGGVVATSVARKLADVAARHQVFVVTHLPQLASRAEAHLLVTKKADGGAAAAGVARLTGEDRVEEIARMLGGDPESSTSRQHARELLEMRELELDPDGS
jgi:DNA repair protein RecN (Recombination protein N)